VQVEPIHHGSRLLFVREDTMSATRNYRFIIIMSIVRLYFLGALYLSFSHIQHAFGMLGLEGFEQLISPLGVDGMAVIGMMFRSKYFDTATRRMGFWLQVPATLVSLGANVYAGTSAGGRIFGFIIVVAYVVTEIASHRAKPATTTKSAPATVDTRPHTLNPELAADIQASFSTPVVKPSTPSVPVPAKRTKKSTKGQPWTAERRARFEQKREMTKALAELKSVTDAAELDDVSAIAPKSPVLADWRGNGYSM
jgi:hypothetical protein